MGEVVELFQDTIGRTLILFAPWGRKPGRDGASEIIAHVGFWSVFPCSCFLYFRSRTALSNHQRELNITIFQCNNRESLESNDPALLHCLSFVSIVVIKCPNQSHLGGKGFFQFTSLGYSWSLQRSQGHRSLKKSHSQPRAELNKRACSCSVSSVCFMLYSGSLT